MTRRGFRDVGIAARTSGELWETCMEIANRAYESAGMASIRKLPTPTRNIGRLPNGAPNLVYEKKSTWDYEGVVGAKFPDFQGRSVVMEAKSSQDRKSLTISDRGLKEHQLIALGKAIHWGRLATIAWCNDGQGYFLPPDRLYAAYLGLVNGSKGRRSISIDQFIPFHGVTVGRHSPVEDWLSPLIEYEVRRVGGGKAA